MLGFSILTNSSTYLRSAVSVLQRLMKRRASLGFRPKVLYLDKGFCSGDIIR